MNLNESAVALIDARAEWNATGITLTAGERFHLVAEGQWIDWTITCDADGYDSQNLVQRMSENLRRAPHERWFALMGALTRDDNAVFRIGREHFFIPETSGELLCFANDVSVAYWNNHGQLRLTVTRDG